MTQETKLRREISRVLREIDLYPYKKEREQMLWDVLYFTAGLLGVQIEEKE